MAGRGAHLTRPAWMTAGAVPGAGAAVGPTSFGSIASLAGPAARGDDDSRDRFRERSRSRSGDRTHRRRGSKSRSRSRERTARRADSSPERNRRTGAASASVAAILGGVAAPSYGYGAAAGSSVVPSSAGVGGAPLIDTKALIAAAMANASASSSNLAVTKVSRRLYIGNIGTTQDQELTAFFNAVVSKAYQPGDHILSCYINHDKRFAFLEFKTVELTSACLALDGLFFKGQQLRIRRPNDYNPHAQTTGPPIALRLSELGIVSQTVPDGPNKVFVGGLPYTLSEPEVRSLLEALGPLRAFHLVKDVGATASKGYAFAEWCDPAIADVAVSGLHGTPLGDKTLTVRRAMPLGSKAAAAAGGASDALMMSLMIGGGGGGAGGLGGLGTMMAPPPAAALPFGGYGGGGPAPASMLFAPPPPLPYAPLPSVAAPPPPPPPPPAAGPLPSSQHPFMRGAPSALLRLSNMVSPAELASDADYAELVEEIAGELRRHGALASIVVPRAGDGAGFVFARFAAVPDAEAAARAVAGRVFAGNTVAVDFQ